MAKKASKNTVDHNLGTTIDGCVLDRKLGQGGMGIAYLATHNDLNRQFVIKILNPALTSSQDTVQRFYREAQSVAKLNDPNIVAIQNVGRDRNLHFIRMEYVDGETLESVVRSRKKLRWPVATQVVRDTASALAHAHSKGIIHRDIKPDNIMFNEKTNVVKVMDFGLAKELQSATKVSMTGQIVGTPFFMSPEQAGGKPTDKRSDIYSLGVTFYYMLSGVKPFNGKNLQEIFLKHFFYTPESPKIYTPDLPQAICDVIRKCLKKKKDERYQDASELHVALAKILDETDATVVAEASKRPTGFLNLRSSPSEQQEVKEAKQDAETNGAESTMVEGATQDQFLNLRGGQTKPVETAKTAPSKPAIPQPRLSSEDDFEATYDQTIVANRPASERLHQHPEFDETSFNQTIKANPKADVSLVADSIIYEEEDLIGGQTQVQNKSPINFSYEDAFGEDIEENYPTLLANESTSRAAADDFPGFGDQTVVRDTNTVVDKFAEEDDYDATIVSMVSQAPPEEDVEDFGKTSVQNVAPLAGGTGYYQNEDQDFGGTAVTNAGNADNTVVSGRTPRQESNDTLVSTGYSETAPDDFGATVVSKSTGVSNNHDHTVVSQADTNPDDQAGAMTRTIGPELGSGTVVSNPARRPQGDETMVPDSEDSGYDQTLIANAGNFAPGQADGNETVSQNFQYEEDYDDEDYEAGHTKVSNVSSSSNRGEPETLVSHNRASPSVGPDETVARQVASPFARQDSLQDETMIGGGALPGAVAEPGAEDTLVRSAKAAFALPSDTVIRGSFDDGNDTLVKEDGQAESSAEIGDDTVAREKAFAETGKFEKPDYSQYADEYGEYQDGIEGADPAGGASGSEFLAADSDKTTAVPTAQDYASPPTGRFSTTSQTIDDLVPLTESQAAKTKSSATRRARVGVESVQLKSTSRFFKKSLDSEAVETPKTNTEAETRELTSKEKLQSTLDKSPVPPLVMVLVLLAAGTVFAGMQFVKSNANSVIKELDDKFKTANQEKDVALRIARLREAQEEYLRNSASPPFFVDVNALKRVGQSIEAAIVKSAELLDAEATRKKNNASTDKSSDGTSPDKTTTPDKVQKVDPVFAKSVEGDLAKAQGLMKSKDYAAGAKLMLALRKKILADKLQLPWHKTALGKIVLPISIQTVPGGMKVFVSDEEDSIGRSPTTIIRPFGSALDIKINESKFNIETQSVTLNDFTTVKIAMKRKRIAQFQLSDGKVPLPGASGLSATTTPIIVRSPVPELTSNGHSDTFYVISREGLLRSFDFKGDKRWVQPSLVGSFGDRMPQPTTLGREAIFASSPGILDEKAGRFFTLCAIEPPVGALLWWFNTDSESSTSAIVGSPKINGKSNRVLALGLKDGRVVFLDPDVGKPLKDSKGALKEFKCRDEIVADPIFIDHYVLVAGRDNRIYSIDITDTPVLAGTLDLADDVSTNFMSLGKTIVFGDRGGNLSSISVKENGEISLIWSEKALDLAVSGPLLVAENRIFASDTKKIVVVESSSGVPVKEWKSLATGRLTPPAYGDEGSIYTLNDSGRIFSLDSLNGDVVWTYDCANVLGEALDFVAAPITVNSEVHGDVLVAVSKAGHVIAIPR